MASGYPPFIFQDAIPAQQMMAHAQAVNEGMRIAELGKARQAEGMFRIAQLQQQQKSQQEKNELDRMIAQSQIAQSQLGNSLREKELTQRGAIAREGFQADIDVAKIQAGRLDPREAINQERQRYDLELEKKEEAKDEVLIREWQILDDELAQLWAKRNAAMPNRSWYEWYDRGQDKSARATEDKMTDAEIAKRKLRQQNIEAILAPRGKVPSPNRASATNPMSPPPTVPQASTGSNFWGMGGQTPAIGGMFGVPSASQLRPPQPTDPRIDAIKLKVAEAIQSGVPPAEALARGNEWLRQIPGAPLF